MIAAILFDLDETLCSREQAFWQWIEREASSASVSVGAREQIARLDARGRGDKAALLEHLDRAFRWELSEAARLERFRAGIVEHLQLDVRVRDMLHRLRRSHRIGLVTNGTSATQRRKLTALGLNDTFHSVTISEEVGFKKPDARAFQHALAQLRAEPAQALFVGDDPIADIAGARAAGMLAFQVGNEGALGHLRELEAWTKAP